MMTLLASIINPGRNKGMRRRVNEWCSSHTAEVREIRNFVAMEMASKRRPSSRLIEEAVDERGIFMPFTSKELVRYSRVNFFG